MGWSILIYESHGSYTLFSIADLKIYDLMRDVLTTEEGVKRYGMKWVAGKRNVPDDEIGAETNLVSKLLERKNSGEPIDLEKELTKTKR